MTALEAAGLVDALKGWGPFTVFATTDEAFAKILNAALDALLANKAELKLVLPHHVASGKVMAADADAEPDMVMSVQGEKLTLSTMVGIKVDKVKMVSADVVADNGVIHAIDTVLMPKWIQPLRWTRKAMRDKLSLLQRFCAHALRAPFHIMPTKPTKPTKRTNPLPTLDSRVQARSVRWVRSPNHLQIAVKKWPRAASLPKIGAALAAVSISAEAATSATLKQDEFGENSFWVISMALIAATLFFFLERARVAP